MMRVARVLLLSGLLSVPCLQAAPRLQPELATLAAVPHFAVAGAQAAHALAARPRRSGEPPRFAAGVALPLGLSAGRWEQREDGSAAWRVRVGSPGAKLLNFRFDRFHLPPSAKLYVYDPQARVVQGPYTSANHTPEGMLWTAVVEGEEAVIELRVAPAERSQVRLALGMVFHGYRTFAQAEDAIPGGGGSASCEVNVACPAGANWGNEIRSAAVFTAQDGVAAELICSGDLVNNMRGDGTPFFLTAHHCRVGWASGVPASSMTVYWNYQAGSCSGTSSGVSIEDNQTGATFDATDAGSDFNLLTLNARPSGSFNVRYAGFDASGAVPTSGVGIHHPEGDIKKISTYTAPASAVNATLCLSNLPVLGTCTQTQQVQAWQVTWAQGITEEGSSGSGLWDQNHRIVGVLSGGSSACGAPGPDVYGRLDAAWTATGSGGSLARWLDPDNTGNKVVDGHDGGGGTGGTGGAGGGWGSQGTGGNAAGLLLLAPLVLLRRRRR